jgi:predicted branched-subunit amino acid permease
VAGIAALAGAWDICAASMPAPSRSYSNSALAFFGGVRAAYGSVFTLVISGTYVGIGALAHGFGLSATWLVLSTVFVWAGPAQVIMISALGTGGAPLDVAIAVTMTAVRLLPMVVVLLPMLRRSGARFQDLLLPAHFTSVSMWVESLRILPTLALEHRVAFCNGLSCGFMSAAVVAGFAGFYLTAGLPSLFAGALLFLTPMSFLISTARNARAMVDRLALVLGLLIGPLLAHYQVGLDLMWTGVAGGTLAYGVHRLSGARA